MIHENFELSQAYIASVVLNLKRQECSFAHRVSIRRDFETKENKKGDFTVLVVNWW